MDQFAQLVTLKIRTSGLNITKEYAEKMDFNIKSKRQLMLAQIEIMQLQIRQFIIARIHYCDHELAKFEKLALNYKKRTIAKKKKIYQNDLKNHMDNIFREHKRN